MHPVVKLFVTPLNVWVCTQACDEQELTPVLSAFRLWSLPRQALVKQVPYGFVDAHEGLVALRCPLWLIPRRHRDLSWHSLKLFYVARLDCIHRPITIEPHQVALPQRGALEPIQGDFAP